MAALYGRDAVRHHLHAQCLAGILASLPGWPQHRPEADTLVDSVREAVARGSTDVMEGDQPPHLPCPACRQRWTEIESIAHAAGTMTVWPTPVASAQHRSVSSDGPPSRPNLPSTLCSLDLAEMQWSTFRSTIRDPAAPMGRRQGPWQGEFQCASGLCAGIHGNHMAPSEPIGVPSLWRRVPAPRAAMPLWVRGRPDGACTGAVP